MKGWPVRRRQSANMFKSVLGAEIHFRSVMSGLHVQATVSTAVLTHDEQLLLNSVLLR